MERERKSYGDGRRTRMADDISIICNVYERKTLWHHIQCWNAMNARMNIWRKLRHWQFQANWKHIRFRQIIIEIDARAFLFDIFQSYLNVTENNNNNNNDNKEKHYEVFDFLWIWFVNKSIVGSLASAKNKHY